MLRGRVVRLERAPLPGGAVPEPTAPRERVTLEVDWGGATTFGEACPLSGFSAECADHVVASLERVGVVSGDAVGCLAPPRAGEELPPSARFALEVAARARAAQLQGVPLAALLARPDAPGAVEVSSLAPLDGPDGELLAAELAPSSRVVKVKLQGGPLAPAAQARLERLARLARLRFDANGRWSREEARERLAELVRYAPELVEQPCPPGALVGLASPLPWAADESLAGEAEAEALLEDGACRVFVLKPSLLGLERALSLGRRAARAGKGLVVTHAFGGCLDLAVARAVAHALAGAANVWASGLAPHVGLSASPLEVPLAPVRDGWLAAPLEPALGHVRWR